MENGGKWNKSQNTSPLMNSVGPLNWTSPLFLLLLFLVLRLLQELSETPPEISILSLHVKRQFKNGLMVLTRIAQADGRETLQAWALQGFNLFKPTRKPMQKVLPLLV